MNSFGKGFATGFLRTVGGRMVDRMETADEYFNAQVERAREVGLKVKGETDQIINTSVTTARQLEQMGVPKDIIMAIANQNPADLGPFQEQVNKAAASGLPVDKEFFDDFVQVSKDFKPSNEDWNSFFGRVYQPIAANAKADPEGFKRDRKGSMLATFFGYDAMEIARDKLAKTEISDGLTAEQLLAYGDELIPNKPLGDGVVTYDYAELGKREAANRGEKEEILSVSEIGGISKSYDEFFNEALLTQFKDWGKNKGQLTPEEKAQVDAVVRERLSSTYGKIPGALDHIDVITSADLITKESLPPSMGEIEGAFKTPAEVPVVNPETLEEPVIQETPTEATGEALEPMEPFPVGGGPKGSYGAPEAPIEPPETVEYQGEVLTYVRPWKDTHGVYKKPDGSLVRIKNEELQQ
jgi:hypothetical protein